MKTILINGIKFFGVHILAIFVTLILASIFAFLDSLFAFSVIACIVYVGLFIGLGWDYGKADGIPYKKIQPSLIRPLLSSLVPSVVGLIFMLLVALQVAPDGVNFAARAWLFPFLGFFRQPDSISILEIFLCMLVIPVSACIGYVFGVRNVSFIDSYDQRMKENAAKKQEKLDADHARRVKLEAERLRQQNKKEE